MTSRSGASSIKQVDRMRVTEEHRRPRASPLGGEALHGERRQRHRVEIDDRLEQRAAQPLLERRRQLRVAPDGRDRLAHLPAGPPIGAARAGVAPLADVFGGKDDERRPRRAASPELHQRRGRHGHRAQVRATCSDVVFRQDRQLHEISGRPDVLWGQTGSREALPIEDGVAARRGHELAEAHGLTFAQNGERQILRALELLPFLQPWRSSGGGPDGLHNRSSHAR
jgi:hypothetical protein